MIAITKEYKAEIAHRLPNHPGACRNIHGHSYKFFVTVTSEEVGNMVMDFKDLKNILEEVIGDWDHTLMLYENDPILEIFTPESAPVKLIMTTFIPTAENMTRCLARIINQKLPEGLVCNKITIYETETSFATWEA